MTGGEAGRPFVGRLRELVELQAALDMAWTDRAPLFLLTGEPGIGKTGLMEEFGRQAVSQGRRMLTGRCWEGGGAPAYWPWMQIVRAAGGDFEQLSHGGTGGSVAQGAAAQPRFRSALDPESARFALFEAVTDFLAEAARDQLVVVMLDDLQAADEPSLLLLRFMATTSAASGLFLVGSYRDGDSRVREHNETFAELSRVGRRIPLRGLTAAEVRDYVTGVADHAPSDEVVTRVHQVTGGNPFFVTELVRLLVAGGTIESATSVQDTLHQLPEEVRALIRRRIAGLSPEAVGSLRVAAVIGTTFDVRVLERTSQLSAGRLLGVLQEAVDAGVLSEGPAVPGRYAFAHDLVRETLYEDLPPERRLNHHRVVGQVLEAISHDDPAPNLAELAYHFTRAAVLGDVEAAIDYSLRAGDQAAALLAYEDAAAHYSRALQVHPLAGAPSSAQNGEILLRLADAQWRAGEPEAARSTSEEAARIAQAAGDPEMLARAAVGYITAGMPARQLGGVLLGGGSRKGQTGRRLIEEALVALPDGDSPLRARLLACLATELYNSEQVDRRMAVADEAVEMARRLGDAEALTKALHGRHWASLGPDLVEARLANAHEMLSVSTATGDQEMALLARHCRLHCYLELADIGAVDAELETMAAIADRLREPFYRWHVVCLHAMRALLEGRFGEGERLAREALQIARLRHSEFATYMHDFVHVVALRWAQGRHGEIRDAVRRHAERYPGIARWRDALLAAELGDLEAARAEVERHAANAFDDLPRDGLWILHHCALAQACVLLEDTQRAARLYELLLPYAERLAVSVSTLPFGPVAMRLGMLATLLHRYAEADDHFEAAMGCCDTLGARPASALVRYEHARMLRLRNAADDEARADALSAQAAELASELDMPGLLGRLDNRIRVGSSQQAEQEAVFRREGDYWTVAYGGRMARLRDLRGLRYLSGLLGAPGHEIHVLDLIQAAEGSGNAGGGRRAADAHESGLRSDRFSVADNVLDGQAKQAYRQRLVDLNEERTQASDWGDSERAALVEVEIDALTQELAAALGLGGRDRGLGSPVERARVSVTKAIRTAVKAVARECPPLGEHLAASVRTGRFCSYGPPGQAPPKWRL